ncbi:hypothetical protein CD351_07470 [Erythrobacter sp. KY5]|uniref:GGDEF domain-containing protein n=1 Tax=Erythrobacter sp. KY5 TaxID=2011159 RepID=UPI000DBF047F|nr:GGDEF domain-containing protein [Erythrobacter sp. KY5]AWW74266.1 hypothetical protein CD351_07470 [Erythrobacter sp. KY5]
MDYTEYVIPLFAFIFAVAFTALWLRDTSRIHVLGLTVTYAAMGASWIIDLLFYNHYGPTVDVISHLLSAISISALGWAMCRRAGGEFPVTAIALVFAISTPLIYIASAHDNIEAIVAVASTTTSFLFIIGAVAWWATKPRHFAELGMLGLMAVLVAIGFVNPVYRQLTIDNPALTSVGSVYLTVNLVSMAVIPVIMAICAFGLLMMDEWLRLKNLARLDPLSNLLARSAFEAEVADMLARGRKDGVPVSLIVADIDHFKSVNDTHGHSVGDEVIAYFGATIAHKIRTSDAAGRVGGEEFCVAVWNCRDEAAAGLAERIRQSFQNASAPRKEGLPNCTASFGVAEACDNEPYPSLFERADAALYRAKNTGRNRVAMASRGPDPMTFDVGEAEDVSLDRSRVVPLRKFK